MTNDAKEWKTVKIEAPVRDEARDDPRTYTEIMRAGLEGGGAPDFDLEQEAMFERLSALEDIAGANNSQREAFRHELEEMNERLAAIESAAKEATNAAQNAERAAEELGGGR